MTNHGRKVISFPDRQAEELRKKYPALAARGIDPESVLAILSAPSKPTRKKSSARAAAASGMPAFVFHGPVTIVIEAKKR
jgi:hypothetical protein